MRLRLPALLLVLAPGCFLFGAEPEASLEAGGGGYGGQLVCADDEPSACGDRACGEEFCGFRCVTPCRGWRQLRVVEDTARPRGLRRAAVLCGDDGTVWVFGGQRVELDGEHHRQVDSTELWSFERASATEIRWTLHEAASTGDGTSAPTARMGAELLPGKDGSFLLFGGLTKPAEPTTPDLVLQDLWRFTGERWQPETIEPRPAGRALPMTARQPDGRVLLLGGAEAYLSGNTEVPARSAWEWDPHSERFTPLSADVFAPLAPERQPVAGAAVFLGDGEGTVVLGGREPYRYALFEGCTNIGGCRVYSTTSYRLDRAHLPEPVLVEDALLRLPTTREFFDAVYVPGVGAIVFDGHSAEGSPDEKAPRGKTAIHRVGRVGRGWEEYVPADDVRLASEDPRLGDEEHPGDRHFYRMLHCPSFGGTLLIGGEEANLNPDHKVFLLPDPAP